jgi:TolB-like protein/class 3 adenylate cyclase/Flp pilus assembly protein TadD
MFTDLVGYSALAHRDEALAIELLELHRGWVREILPRFGGLEIETVGDAFLIEFAGALAAVECGVAIQRRFAEHNAAAPPDRRMELRIGVHLGDIEHKGDKVFGDGVNIASRIHGMAKPGGICVSEAVHQAVRNRPAFQFASLGTPPLKNITTPLELFELAPSQHLAPPAAAEAAGQKAPAAETPRRWLPAAAMAAGVLALAGTAWLLLRPAGGPATGGASVAVLPFANMSADRDNEYFADGVHDTILTHLSRIRDLKVISRTSVMEYKNSTRNLREIAGALGVAHIVEGSVQRQGNRVRINAQLIRADTDAHLWSENYDRDIADVFAIQSDVAQKIAASVQAQLTAREKGQIEQRPTRNAEAYELYLRGKHEDRFSQGAREDVERALGFYQRAVALDPEFALGHAAVSEAHSAMYWWDYDRSDPRRALALAAAERALQIVPDLPEGKVAVGRYWYWGHRDYERAQAHIAAALEQRPGDAEALLLLGYVERRSGRMREAIAHLRQGAELDPLNPQAGAGVAETLGLLRDFAAAEREWARVAALPGARLFDRSGKAAAALVSKGDFAEMAALVPKLIANAELGDSRFCVYVFHSWSGRHAEAIAALEGWREDWVPVINDSFGTNFTYPKAYLVAQAYRAKGDKAAATAQFIAARRVIETGLARAPDDARMHAALGVTLAALGDSAGAQAAARKAGELMPISRDALAGPVVAQLIAQAHAWLGDTDAALAGLEVLLNAPTHVTPAALRLNPVWDPLREDPRFQKLLDHAPGKTGSNTGT